MSLDAIMQNEAARELMAALANAGAAMRPLTTYLGFFRSASRALAWERALKLAREVLELTQDRAALAAALSETCASLDAKRAGPSWKPLSSHGYLKAVLTAVSARVDRAAPIEGTYGLAPAPTSKTGRAIARLEERKHGR